MGDTPDRVKLGECKLLEEIMIGEDSLLRFSGIPNAEACTVVLRGGTKHILAEAERSLHDAICVLSQTVHNTKVITGGGSSEMEMALAVEEAAKEVPGKRALAMEAFARALRAIPGIIADNAGYDSAELVSVLGAAHYNKEIRAGLDMNKGEIADMLKLGIMESFQVKLHVLVSASEAAEQILRVDEVVKCAPRRQ